MRKVQPPFLFSRSIEFGLFGRRGRGSASCWVDCGLDVLSGVGLAGEDLVDFPVFLLGIIEVLVWDVAHLCGLEGGV